MTSIGHLHCPCPSCENDRAAGRPSIEQLTQTLARERGTSILIIEVRRVDARALSGPTAVWVVSDHASMHETDGKEPVLRALLASVTDIAAALLAMIRQLGTGQPLQTTFEPPSPKEPSK